MLRQAVENTGKSWGDYSGALENVITKGINLGFADNDQRDALALLTAQTGDATEAQKRLALAEDLSRGAKIDLGTASKLLGKVTDENVGVLKRYGIQVEKGASATELFGAIQQKFGGQAATFAASATGKWEVFNLKMGELQEQVGGFLLPIFTQLGTVAVDALDSISISVGNLSAVFKPAIDVVQQFLQYLSPTNSTDFARNLFGANFGPRIDAVVRSLKSVASYVVSIGQVIGKVATGGLSFGKALEAIGANAHLAGRWVGELAGQLGGIAVELGKGLLEQVGLIDWGAVGQVLLDGLVSALSFLYKAEIDAAALVARLYGGLVDAAVSFVKGLDWGKIGSAITDAIAAVVRAGDSLATNVLTALSEQFGHIDLGVAWANVQGVAVDLVGKLGLAAGAAQTWINDRLKEIDLGKAWAGVTEFAIDIGSKLGMAAGAAQTWISDRLKEIHLDEAWKGVTAFTVDLGAKLLIGATAVKDWLAGAWSTVTTADWAGIWGSVTGIGAGLLASGLSIVASVTTWIKGAWTALSAAWPGIWQSAGDIGAGLIASGLEIGKSVVTWLQETWRGVNWGQIWSQVQGIGTSLVGTIGSIAKDVETWLTVEWNKVNWSAVFGGVDAKGFSDSLNAWMAKAISPEGWLTSLNKSIADLPNKIDTESIGKALAVPIEAAVALAIGIVTGRAGEQAGKLGSTIGESVAGQFVMSILGLPARLQIALNETMLRIGQSARDQIIANVGPSITAGFNSIGPAITGWLNTTSASILTGAGKFGSNIVAGLVSGVVGLPATLLGVWTTVSTWLTSSALSIFTGAIEFGKNIVSGLVNGTITLAGELATILASIIGPTGWIATSVTSIFTKAKEIGTNIVSGAVAGLSTLGESIKSAIHDALYNMTFDIGIFHLGKGGHFYVTLPSISLPSIGGGDSSTGEAAGQNAQGTRNWKGGLSWVGELGPELVNLPRGAQVFPNKDIGQLAHILSLPHLSSVVAALPPLKVEMPAYQTQPDTSWLASPASSRRGNDPFAMQAAARAVGPSASRADMSYSQLVAAFQEALGSFKPFTYNQTNNPSDPFADYQMTKARLGY